MEQKNKLGDLTIQVAYRTLFCSEGGTKILKGHTYYKDDLGTVFCSNSERVKYQYPIRRLKSLGVRPINSKRKLKVIV